MRLVDLEEFKKIRTKVSLQTALAVSVPLFIILFLLSISGGFVEAVLFGGLFGILVFGTIFGIRELTHRRVESKRKKLKLEGDVIDVIAGREIGILEILPDELNFYNLTPGGNIKNFTIKIDHNLEFILTKTENKGFSKLSHHGIKRAELVSRDSNNMSMEFFTFYDIDGLYDKLEEVIKGTNANLD